MGCRSSRGETNVTDGDRPGGQVSGVTLFVHRRYVHVTIVSHIAINDPLPEADVGYASWIEADAVALDVGVADGKVVLYVVTRIQGDRCTGTAVQQGEIATGYQPVEGQHVGLVAVIGHAVRVPDVKVLE